MDEHRQALLQELYAHHIRRVKSGLRIDTPDLYPHVCGDSFEVDVDPSGYGWLNYTVAELDGSYRDTSTLLDY